MRLRKCLLAGLLLMALAASAAPSDQIGVMLQLENMLPASNRFGVRLPDVDKEFDLRITAPVTIAITHPAAVPWLSRTGVSITSGRIPAAISWM